MTKKFTKMKPNRETSIKKMGNSTMSGHVSILWIALTENQLVSFAAL